jgi:hypothetical protein
MAVEQLQRHAPRRPEIEHHPPSQRTGGKPVGRAVHLGALTPQPFAPTRYVVGDESQGLIRLDRIRRGSAVVEQLDDGTLVAGEQTGGGRLVRDVRADHAAIQHILEERDRLCQIRHADPRIAGAVQRGCADTRRCCGRQGEGEQQQRMQ